jgi:hypothetical protein
VGGANCGSLNLLFPALSLSLSIYIYMKKFPAQNPFILILLLSIMIIIIKRVLKNIRTLSSLWDCLVCVTRDGVGVIIIIIIYI